MGGRYYTPEEVTAVREGFRLGLSDSKIAKRIARTSPPEVRETVTRNRVMRIRHSLGLHRRPIAKGADPGGSRGASARRADEAPLDPPVDIPPPRVVPLEGRARLVRPAAQESLPLWGGSFRVQITGPGGFSFQKTIPAETAMAMVFEAGKGGAK